MLTARPEVIVLADAGAIEDPQSQATLAARPGWAQLAALRQGRVFSLHTDWVARPGPRLGLGLRQLAALLHPGKVSAPPLPRAVP